jgi:phosphatidylglycerophosphate synthase
MDDKVADANAARAMQAGDLLTWASALSWLRLAIAASLHWLEPTPWLVVAYLVAVGTDVADGWVARRTGTCSDAGAVLDAWCDKTLHVNMALVMTVAGRMPGVWMAWLFARELVQAPLILPLAHRFRTGGGPRPRTTTLGRAASVAVTLALALVATGAPSFPVVLVAGALSFTAGVHYAWVHLGPAVTEAKDASRTR